jgi:hypothetical protein
MEKTEYSYLLDFCVQVSTFVTMIGKFTHVDEAERRELELTLSVLQRKLSETMPRVQDREAAAATEQFTGF